MNFAPQSLTARLCSRLKFILLSEPRGGRISISLGEHERKKIERGD